MILLSFRVRNHKSIRDEVVLDLIQPSLRTLTPADGDWSTAVYPVAAVFGGNGTGKSAILNAIYYAFQAIAHSSTTWQSRPGMTRAPFRLDGESRQSPSLYELDFVYDGRRHLYGFEVDADGIVREWLREIRSTRWRSVMQRERDAVRITGAGRGLLDVSERELVLSRALTLSKSSLHDLATELVTHFDVVLVKDSHREHRLQTIANSLMDGTTTFSDLEALLAVADIGVTKVDVREETMPDWLREAMRRATQELERASDGRGGKSARVQVAAVLDEVQRHLVFTHRGTIDECPPFGVDDESDGTVAWLAIAVPALDALRNGGVLVVDEIDASLHPHLLELLLMAFSSWEVNTRHAQLIFSSHESYVLSPLSEVKLDPEQVWFTDKSYEGATELTCLADFPRHPDANVAKRYLTGRYGGTPRLSPNLFLALVGSRAI